MEWAEKSEALKARLPTYQNLKAQLAELEAEARVQAHTLEVLRQQQAAQGGGGMEHEQPVGGVVCAGSLHPACWRGACAAMH